ncbi:TetR/AcrR family transcriptional regulator [Clostridium omnivorum]|uniref:TetR family transcriptional regulator n=1 Tax=Clostridium omnivorum TaxID=1604902 RepID=A0ABQ5N325_9CLOT|nr:TetR/AcrR family transcriptional regulator [Clostridium sp. E14]GLC29609.1 TetR family transcriptional regulator [Clostridium sp. E14]
MNGYERRREQKKEAILKTAGELFFQKGYDAVSTSEIAEKANVAQSSIYNFFENKHELYIMAVKRTAIHNMDEYDKILSSDNSFYEKLSDFLKLKMNGISSGSKDFNSALNMQNPEIQNFLNKLITTRAVPIYHKLIELGRLEGAIDQDIESETIIDYINGFADAIMQPNIYNKLIENEKYFKDFYRLFWFGISGGKIKE